MPEDISGGSMAACQLPSVTSSGFTASDRCSPASPWQEQALCTGEDPELFFPSHGAPGTRARQICGICPVRVACLEFATEADEFGIWGGLDQEERRALRRKRRRQAAAAMALRTAG